MPVTHGVAGSSPVRTAEILERKFRDFLFSVASPQPSNIRFCENRQKSAKVGRAAIQTARCASKEVHNVWQSASRQHRHRGSPQSGRIDAATLCAIGEVHNVDPLSVNPGPRPGHNAGTTRTATRCRCIWMEKKKARQSDELCFLVASMKQHLQT